MRRALCFSTLPLFCGLAASQELVWERVGTAGVSGFGRNTVTASGNVANLGDLDGDGRDDLLLLGEEVQTHKSKLWFFSGEDGRTLRTREQSAICCLPYWRIAAAGDVDDDGIPDYATTIKHDQGVLPNRIEVCSGADDSLLWNVQGPWESGLGYGLLGNLDLDGDGRPDLVATAPLGRTGRDRLRLGAVHAYSNAGTRLWSVVGTEQMPIGMHGHWNALGHVGDVDADGADDVVVGAFDPAQLAGVVVVLSGRTGAVLVRGLGPSGGPIVGETTDGCGDLDRDGVPDFVGGVSAGSLVMAFSGRTGRELFRWQRSNNLGFALKSGGVDLDQDGIPDIVAGSPGEDLGGFRRGSMFAYSGRDGSMLFRLDSQNTRYSTSLGWTVEVLRAHPGNPFPLFVVTEPQYGSYSIPQVCAGCYLGRVLVYRASPPGTDAFGRACRGTLPSSPRIGMRDLDASDLGASGVRLHLSDAAPGSPAILLLGFSRTQWGAARLPLPLDPFGFPGCLLYTSVDLTGFASTGTQGIDDGYTSLDLSLPLAPPGQGSFTVHGQWLSVGSGATWPGGLSAAMTWRH